MEFLRYILWLFVIINLMISGALLFNYSKTAYRFLAAFCLVYTFEQVDFLYVTGPMLELAPYFYMSLYSLCLLAGPLLFFHIKSLVSEKRIKKQEIILHFLPFAAYLAYSIFTLSIPASERIQRVANEHESIINLLNYVKVFHVVFYSWWIIRFLRKNSRDVKSTKRHYVITIIALYCITAVALTVLTAIQASYDHFIYYFLACGCLVILCGYFLRYRPELVEELRDKYFASNLGSDQMIKITVKIEDYMKQQKHFLNKDLDLNQLSIGISEKKHHVSQTLSTVFNQNFNDLLNKKRIEHAKSLLLDPRYDGAKILAIALDSGYTNKSTFYRAFVRYALCTPGEYRKKMVSNN